MIDVGLEEGAKLVIGGPGRPDDLQVGLYARPTIYSNVRRDMRIAHEEIFGPVLSIIPYDTVDEAIEIANDTVYGLGAHVQGTDIEAVRTVAGQIRSGQVHLNYPDWDPNAPFGGYKRSGNGREYGRRGHGRISRDQGRSRILSMKFISESESTRLISHELAFEAVRKALVAAASPMRKCFRP